MTVVEYSYRERGLFSEAMAIRASHIDPTPARLEAERLSATSGYRGFLRHAAHGVEEDASRTGTYVSPYLVAYYYAAGDDRDRALMWLEKAYAQRHPALVFIGVDPVFDALRGNPTFELIERQVGVGPRR